jgi:hypothetical protein
MNIDLKKTTAIITYSTPIEVKMNDMAIYQTMSCEPLGIRYVEGTLYLDKIVVDLMLESQLTGLPLPAPLVIEGRTDLDSSVQNMIKRIPFPGEGFGIEVRSSTKSKSFIKNSISHVMAKIHVDTIRCLKGDVSIENYLEEIEELGQGSKRGMKLIISPDAKFDLSYKHRDFMYMFDYYEGRFEKGANFEHNTSFTEMVITRWDAKDVSIPRLVHTLTCYPSALEEVCENHRPLLKTIKVKGEFKDCKYLAVFAKRGIKVVDFELK